jgi:hypothetical protein
MVGRSPFRIFNCRDQFRLQPHTFLDVGRTSFTPTPLAAPRFPQSSAGTGPTDSRIEASALAKSDWSSSKAGPGKSRSPGAMARSVFKRAVKMGIKEVRKSIAGLGMGKPRRKVNPQRSVPELFSRFVFSDYG